MSERQIRMTKCVMDLPSYDSDASLQRMSLAEEGALFRLVRAMWHLTPEPGVVKADAHVLRALTRTTFEEWVSVRTALRRFFDTKSRPGYWVDQRMVLSYRLQNEVRAGYSERGAKGANARWRKDGLAIAGPMAIDSGSGAGTGSGSGSGTGVENKEKENVGAVAPRTRPTLEEVRAYCTERRNTVDPQAWMNNYQANGWMVGPHPMHDWRALVRKWERNGLSTPTPAPDKPKRRDPTLERVEEWRRAKEAEVAREPLGDKNAAKASLDIGSRENVAQDVKGRRP